MKILERYNSAARSSNLKSEERTVYSDTDVLGGAGLAAKRYELGIALARLFGGGKVNPVIEVLTEMTNSKAGQMRLKLKRTQAKDLSKAVIAYYRYGSCQPCGGTGYRKIVDTPVLGDQCTHCLGYGRLPFDNQFHQDIRPIAHWLMNEIEKQQSMAGQEVMKKISRML